MKPAVQLGWGNYIFETNRNWHLENDGGEKATIGTKGEKRV